MDLFVTSSTYVGIKKNTCILYYTKMLKYKEVCSVTCQIRRTILLQ